MDSPDFGQQTTRRQPLPNPSKNLLLGSDQEKTQSLPLKTTDSPQRTLAKQQKPISVGNNQELLPLFDDKLKPNTYSSISSSTPGSDETSQGSPSQKEGTFIPTQDSSSLGLSSDGSQGSTPPTSDSSPPNTPHVVLNPEGDKPESAIGRRPKLEIPQKNVKATPEIPSISTPLLEGNIQEQTLSQGNQRKAILGDTDSDSEISGIELPIGDKGTKTPLEQKPANDTKNSGKPNFPPKQELQEVVQIEGDPTDWQFIHPINEESNITFPKFFPESLTAPYVPVNEMKALSLLSPPNVLIEAPGEEVVTFSPKTKFEQLLNTLDDAARSKLSYLKQQILNQSLTKAQKAAVISAVVLAMTMTVGMWPIYTEGLGYIQKTYNWEWLNYLDADDDGAGILAAMVTLSILPDALARNISLLKKAATSIGEEGIKVGRTLLVGLASFLPSFIQPFFLIKLELHNMEVTKTHGWDNQYAISMVVLGTALLLDSWIANFDMALEMEEDLKKWVETPGSFLAKLLAYDTLQTRMPTEEEITRCNVDKHLNDLISMLPLMTEEKVDKIFGKIVNAHNRVPLKFPGLDTELMEAGELALVLHYLMAWGKEASGIKKCVKLSWRTSIDNLAASAEKPVIATALILGTFMRVVALQLIGETMLGIFCSGDVSEIGGWVFSALGTPILTAFEYKGMNKFFNNFLKDDAPMMSKFASVVWGGVWTIPLFVLCLEACDNWWANDVWMLLAIPYLLAEFMTLTTLFHDSYSKVGTSITKFHSQVTRKKLFESVPQCKEGFGSEPTLNYKINYIRERARGYQQYLPALNIPLFKQLQNEFFLKNSVPTGRASK